jgi:hypothetical protein
MRGLFLLLFQYNSKLCKPYFGREKQMKKICLMLSLVLGLTSFATAEVRLTDSSTVTFATVETGQRILTNRDKFIQCLSPFDRAGRMKTDKDVSEKEFLSFVGRNVLSWEEQEKQRVESAFRELKPALEKLSLPLPKTIYMIKTTGNEEGNAAYTRSNALVFPRSNLAMPEKELCNLICHELFHVMSRNDPNLCEQLYKAIGFEKCDEVNFPPVLRSRKITNPDAPNNDHCIRVQVAGKTVSVVPILFSGTEKYDVKRGGEFFEYLQFKFIPVVTSFSSSSTEQKADSNSPQLLSLEQFSGFFEQVGRNTGYIIHPEEILADNFKMLVLEENTVSSPEILKKIRDILTKTQSATPITPANNPPPAKILQR